MTLQILVDVNDDGIFDPNTESLTHDVLEVRWRSGLASPYDSVAQIGEAEIIVRNSDQAYSPELSAFTIGKRVCIRSQEGDTTRTLFVGILALIVPDSGNYGVKTTRLIAHDALATLHHADVRLNPQVQHTADVILQDILAHAPLRPTVLYGRWLLGQPNQSELGQNTRFVPPPRHHLAVGQTTFAYVSDTWQDGISANHAIE